MENHVVSRRLRSCSSFHLNNLVQSTISLPLDNQAQKTQRDAFKLLIEEEASLVLEYNALRALIKQALCPPVTVNKDVLLDLVREALSLAQTLDKQYDLYINEHPAFLSRRSLKKHQQSYRVWLGLSAPVFVKNTPKTWWEQTQAWLFAEFTTDRMNPRRLYLLRERRLLVLLVPVIKDFGQYRSWILWADAYVAPLLMYLNLIFFMPRLIYNIHVLFDNVFDQNKMKAEAKHLDFFTRFKAQWNRLWPQIMNDVAWAISAICMCVVFTGAWQPMGIYLSVCMQFYDVLIAGTRAYIDLNRLNNLRKQYQELTLDPDISLDTQQQRLHALYCHHLDVGIQRERALLYLALVNSVVLFLAVCMALPCMVAIHPLLPLVGAVIAIVMTIINFQTRSYLNASESVSLDNLLTLGQPICPEPKSRAISETVLNPMRPRDGVLDYETNSIRIGAKTPPVPSRSPLLRSHSNGNAPRFFIPSSSDKPLSRSQSHLAFHVLSDSSSPTGIAMSHSLDDLDAYSYSMGGHKY